VGSVASVPLTYLNGESGGARDPGHFYRYQIQTVNGAGSASEWSTLSATVDTGLPAEIITKVTNYPNPVDTRKGGLEGRTFISYLLASDADVDITVYDLLGYRVMHWNFQGGSLGGRQGANNVPNGGWDGTNESGQKVSKGGYLAQIKVSGAKGSSTVIRKIGVIH
jgi:flagellar hook assembly protein FlgD